MSHGIKCTELCSFPFGTVPYSLIMWLLFPPIFYIWFDTANKHLRAGNGQTGGWTDATKYIISLALRSINTSMWYDMVFLISWEIPKTQIRQSFLLVIFQCNHAYNSDSEANPKFTSCQWTLRGHLGVQKHCRASWTIFPIEVCYVVTPQSAAKTTCIILDRYIYGPVSQFLLRVYMRQ